LKLQSFVYKFLRVVRTLFVVEVLAAEENYCEFLGFLHDPLGSGCKFLVISHEFLVYPPKCVVEKHEFLSDS
jgi:hypothetical protein